MDRLLFEDNFEVFIFIHIDSNQYCHYYLRIDTKSLCNLRFKIFDLKTN